MQPSVAVIMGSSSDWPTMQLATQVLEQFGVPFHVEVVSAHRTPDKLMDLCGCVFSKQGGF